VIRVRSVRERPVSDRLLGLVCPFCKDAISGSDAFVECAACGTWFHEECFLENRGCMTFGCPEQRSKRPPGVAPRPRLAVAPAPLPPGLNRLEVLLALVQGSGLATAAMVALLLSIPPYHGSERAYPAFFGSTVLVVYFAVKLLVAVQRSPRVELSSFQRIVCIACGLATGLAGVPIWLLSAAKV
jgi:hypothetical protein